MKHITLNNGMDVIIHSIYTPFKIFDYCKKTHTQTLRICAKLIKKCTMSNNVSTLVNKHKLHLIKVIVGVIFIRRMILKQQCLTRLNMDIHLILTFHNILLSFVSMISTNLANSKCFLGL